MICLLINENEAGMEHLKKHKESGWAKRMNKSINVHENAEKNIVYEKYIS